MNCIYCSALPSLGQLPSLNELCIAWLDGVVTVDQEFYRNSGSLMKAFGSLKLLVFKTMCNWVTWENLGAQNEVETFSQLEYLYIEYCPKLRGRLPVYPHSLDKLVIRNCQHLEGLESVVLPEQHKHDGLLSKLKILEISGCEKCELPMHQEFSSLEELYLRDCCDSLVCFPLDTFPNLKHILIRRCKNLQLLEYKLKRGTCQKRGKSTVQSSLVKLVIIDCPKLRYMPEEGFPTSLHLLEIENCDSVLKEELERKEGEEWLKVARVPNMWIDRRSIQGADTFSVRMYHRHRGMTMSTNISCMRMIDS